MSPESPTVVDVDGRRLALSNLDKVLYPVTGFTKAEVIWYYTHIAPVMLPHLRGRPVTFTRYPNGVDEKSFFEKHVPNHAPDWLPTVLVPRSNRSSTEQPIEFALLSEPAALVWSANLAALELHVPLWRSLTDGEYGPFDQMVFDLDPGAPADIVDCCRVAGWIRRLLDADGRECYPKTSGSKGLQLYVPVDPPKPWEEVHARAHELAVEVERQHRDEVVSRMRKDLRPGKVFIDWSQNHPMKTTIAVYSLRARETPTASTPVTWDEVEQCEKRGDPTLLRFEANDVLKRVEKMGDLFAPLASSKKGGHRGRGSKESKGTAASGRPRSRLSG